MPEENSTPIWTAQNDSQVTSQSWNDFMLDFWDETNREHIETPEVETNNLEEEGKKGDTSDSIDIDFDINDNSWEEKDESGSEGEVKQDLQEDNKESQNEFDFSLDEELANEENEEVSNEVENDEEIKDDEDVLNDIFDDEDNSAENNTTSQNETESSILLEDNLENENSEELVNIDSLDDVNNESAEQLENNDENKYFDISWENLKDSEVTEIEKKDDNINENLDEINDNKKLYNEMLDSNLSQQADENKLEDNSEDLEQTNNLLFEDKDFDENNNTNNEFNVENNDKKIEDFWLEDDERNQLDMETIDKNDADNNKNSENLDFVMDIESDNEKETESQMESENQREIWDNLEEKNVEDSVQEDSIDVVEKINEENNIDELSQVTEKKLDEDVKQEPESTSSNQVIEIPSYDLSDKKYEVVEKIQDENINPKSENGNNDSEWIKELDSQAEAINSVADSVQHNEESEIKQDNSEQVTSTLSLDQILDSELNSNPQFTDNSKAVPKNVQVSSGLFGNKKMVWIIAWVWVFLLAWFCAILAFPFWWSNEKEGSKVNTWDVVLTGDHYSPDPENPLEYTWITWPTTTIIPEEPEEPDEPETPSEPGEPQPFVPCTDIDCPWEEPEEPEEPEEKLDANYVSDKISSFKSQAERYYLKWDDMQDKKLIKYAAQAIHLCEVYQEQVDNGEWLDEETLSSFKTKMNSLLNNMDKYLNWDDDSPTYVKSNYDEEYNFTWKDELLDYIYNGSSY